LSSNTIGQVLFIDDEFDTIAEATKYLLKKGFQVQYWNGITELPDSIYNARIVFIDLDLTKIGEKTGGIGYYAPAVEALKKLSGPFIVIILAREFDEEDAITLSDLLKRTTGPFCGFVSQEGLQKEELQENIERLSTLVDTLLSEFKILNLIISWEKIFDNAKDGALSEIADDNTEISVRALIKLLCKNFGEDKAATREFIDIMTRLVSRKTFSAKDFERLPPLISELAKDETAGPTILDEKDFLLYSRLMFYKPAEEEEVMTGDIFMADELKYGIVITPKCDILQAKTPDVLVCFGFPLIEEYFDKRAFPPHANDPEIAKLHKEGKPMTEIVEKIKSRYLKANLPGRLCTLWHFKPRAGVKGICFNFHDVQSIKKQNLLKHWKRLARLDSPYVENMLEKYGNLISRVGTLEINKSPYQLQKCIKKIDEARNKEEERKEKVANNSEQTPSS
jgi:hypothetical protein